MLSLNDGADMLMHENWNYSGAKDQFWLDLSPISIN